MDDWTFFCCWIVFGRYKRMGGRWGCIINVAILAFSTWLRGKKKNGMDGLSAISPTGQEGRGVGNEAIAILGVGLAAVAAYLEVKGSDSGLLWIGVFFCFISVI